MYRNTLFGETERTKPLVAALLTAQVIFSRNAREKNTNASGDLPKRPDMTERHNKSSDTEKTINLRCQPRSLFSVISIWSTLSPYETNE